MDYSQVTGYKAKTQKPVPFQNTSSEKWSQTEYHLHLQHQKWDFS